MTDTNNTYPLRLHRDPAVVKTLFYTHIGITSLFFVSSLLSCTILLFSGWEGAAPGLAMLTIITLMYRQSQEGFLSSLRKFFYLINGADVSKYFFANLLRTTGRGTIALIPLGIFIALLQVVSFLFVDVPPIPFGVLMTATFISMSGLFLIATRFYHICLSMDKAIAANGNVGLERITLS